MKVTAFTTKEEILTEIKNLRPLSQSIKVVKLEDEESTLFQLITPHSINLDFILNLGLTMFNPSILASKDELKVTFLINK